MALYDVSTTEKKTSPELVAGGTLYADNPLGTILPFGSATIPTGWLLCDGTAISRTTYSELFAVIGTTFGSGDGSTTFNVPDLRGKVPVGFNTNETEFSALGNTGGEKTHTLTVSEIPSHNHTISDAGVVSMYQGGGGDVYNCLSQRSGETISTSYKGSGTAHNNLQPYNTVNYIIKAKMTAVPVDFMSVVDEAVEEAMADIGTYISNSASVHPSTSNADFEICRITLPAGKWIVTLFSDLNTAKNDAYFNANLYVSDAVQRTTRFSGYNGGGTLNMIMLNLSVQTDVIAKGFAYAPFESDSSLKQKAILEAIRIK